MRHARTVVMSLLAIAAAAPPTAAPDGAEPSPQHRFRLRLGGGLLLGSPTGELSDQIGVGGGLAGNAVWTLPGGILGLRVDGSWLLYGSETVRTPLSRPLNRISADVTTDNWIAHLAVGPQVMAPSGRVRPYLNAFAGVSYFSTTSEATGPDPFAVPFAVSTNLDDAAFSYGAGAGFLVPMGSGHACLDLGALYVRSGRVSYLARGDIRDDGRGGIAFTPRRSAGNMVQFHAGVTVVP